MAVVKHPKKYYYTMRNRYMRDLKQIGYRLSLAVTQEEDALLWEKYKKVLDRCVHWKDRRAWTTVRISS